jgi:tryptophanyl-tRNA synthetase
MSEPANLSSRPLVSSATGAVGPTAGGRPRVLSGMRPTGKLHLGNYMGALANWVKLQDQYECYFFIADWHALTTDYADPSRLKLNTLDVALDFLAAGLDPEKSTIFIQSHVPQHAELHLLFSMITPLGWLERVPTYKEQQENITGKDLSTYGFLGYPLLQAADILIYQPQFVPVGQDQIAHVELTREVARRFNSMYKSQMIDGRPIFPEPDALLTPSPKLPGTDGRKMSKSYGNTIGLTEDPKSAAKKIEGMSTNGQRPRHTDVGDPELCPVADLHKVFSSAEVIAETQSACRTASIGCLECKAMAAKSVSEHLHPIFERRKKLREEDAWEILYNGADKAAKIAEQTLLLAKDVTGLARTRREMGVFPQSATPIGQNFNAVGSTAIGIRNSWLAQPELRDIPLKEAVRETFATEERFLEEPLITASNKRVLVIASAEVPSVEHTDSGKIEKCFFDIPQRSYEVWVLLLGNELIEDKEIISFVLPQKVFSQYFSNAKKSLKKGEKIRVEVMKEGGKFSLKFENCNYVNISEYRNDFEQLK